MFTNICDSDILLSPEIQFILYAVFRKRLLFSEFLCTCSAVNYRQLKVHCNVKTSVRKVNVH